MGKSFCIFALALLSCPLFGFWDLPEPKKMGLPSCMEMPELKLIPSPRYGERNRKWQGVPSIERTSGGRLWAAWYAGSVWEGFSDRGNYIVVYTSGDDGKTWELVAVYDAAGLTAGIAETQVLPLIAYGGGAALAVSVAYGLLARRGARQGRR